jgi:hypothetical protein
MASNASNGNGSQLLVVGDTGGITVIDPSTPLKRLNYYDGKFLRAADFDVEQGYLRQLVALSNQGLGPGVVYGYNTTLGSGDTVQIGPGLAIDPYGKVLLLQSSFAPSIQALIDASKRVPTPAPGASGTAGTGGFSDCVQVAAPPPTAVVPVSDIYVIAICSAEALCGQEDVFGVQCQDACVTSTDRPYRLDGIVVRALPLQLVTPFPTSQAVAIDANLYLRSKVAHSWFADEVLKHPDAISRAGLLSGTWCLGAGYDGGCCEVPLAVVARAGATTVFLDAWIVRRERIDAPARRYWQWKTRMRPWDVFLAQILQFQCQLAGLLSSVVVPGSRAGDPCAAQHQALGEAAQFVELVRSGLSSLRSISPDATVANQPALLSLSLTQISDLRDKLQIVLKSAGTPAQPKDRVLICGGILELSSAGYLPVVNGSSISVNDQVRALLGEGLDLRFCITTVDYVAHAIEEAQHMDRISLIQGIDDPSNKPHVDILVPAGKVVSSSITPTAGLYDASLTFSATQTGGLVLKGAAREATLDSGGTALYLGAAGLSQAVIRKLQVIAQATADPTAKTQPVTFTADLEQNVFIQTTAAAAAEVDTRVASAASQARGFINATAAGFAETAVTVATTEETVDGLWLSARIDQRIGLLGINGLTAVSLRAVLATQPASPVAIELVFHGTLSISGISSAPAGPVVTGTVNGILSMELIREQQSLKKITTLLTQHGNWPVTLTYTGDDAIGSITVDLTLAADPLSGLRLTKTFVGSSSQITYRLASITTPAGAGTTVDTLGALELVADAAVVNPGNAFHGNATHGLDLVQAALAVSEPVFETNAAALLFPALPAATRELIIQAVLDWVAFTRRREKRCEREVEPVPPLPPRSYRVINLTVQSADEAKTLVTPLQDQAKLVQLIQRLLALETERKRVKLVVKFAGGTAVAQSDLVAAEADWKTFGPGSIIYYVAIGAVGESDAALQLSRVKTLAGAISADSKEDASSQEVAITPYPPGAAMADADGVMFFVTVAAAVPRSALLIYTNWDNGQHIINPAVGTLKSPMEFSNDVPQGDALTKFIAGLTPNQPVNGVTLTTPKAVPDAGAATRLKAVIDALVAAKKPAPTAARQVTQALSAQDRTELGNVPVVPNDFDDVIFFESN